MKKIDLGI